MATRLQDDSPSLWPSLRLARITVENYKSLDQLSLDLPPPSTPEQLDAFVLGSRNGVGKSSLLECCALVVAGAIFPKLMRREGRLRDLPTPYDLLVRSGADHASIEAVIQVGGQDHGAGLEVSQGELKPREDPKWRKDFPMDWRHHFFNEYEFIDSILGLNTEPLVTPPLLLFHSYRKVLEGRSALGAMVNPDFARRRYPPGRYGGPGPLSTFKVALIQALMARSDLFEGIEAKGDSQVLLDQLNGLLREYAGGTVDKLRPGPDGTLELRVSPVGGGASFSFDGLSSGQKEIIATLFLIWHMTLDRPSIVLIDEPELHLNAEWQRILVHRLGELAPRNQYLLATHSEEVFGSVSADRRLMLQGG